MISKADTPDALKRCQPIFSKLVDGQSTGTLMTEINDLSSRVYDQDLTEECPSTQENTNTNSGSIDKMSDELRLAFQSISPDDCPTHARFVSNVTISGFVHSTRQKHQGNSQVFFFPIHSKASMPGFIESIFSVEKDSRQFVAIHRLLPSSSSDPFQQWPFLGVKMYDNSLGELEVIPLRNIEFQFASCSTVWEEMPTVVVVKLTRVCPITLIRIAPSADAVLKSVTIPVGP